MTKPKPAATASKPHSLTIAAEPDKTREAQIAGLATAANVPAALVIADFSKALFGTLPLSDLLGSLKEHAGTIKAGDLSRVEAMLCGLPVVAAEVRGPAEQVVPEETGLLVPAGDGAALATALQRLVQDAPLRTRMGQAGRARACERYDEAKVLARTLDLLGL